MAAAYSGPPAQAVYNSSRSGGAAKANALPLHVEFASGFDLWVIAPFLATYPNDPPYPHTLTPPPTPPLPPPPTPPPYTALIPSGVAVGVGMYVTADWTLPRVAGALLERAWRRRSPRSHQKQMLMVASGLVLGEGVMSIVALALTAMGVPRLV